MSNLYKVLLGFFISFSCVGCIVKIPYDYRFLDSGHYWPKREKWTVSPETNVLQYTESPLAFGGVFFLMSTSSDEWCHILRFWPSGQVMEKSVGFPPSLDDVDDLHGSYLGYYRIENGQVVLETYGPVPPRAGQGGYNKRTFVFTDEGLQFIPKQTRWERQNLPNTYLRYVRYPIEGMENEPFW